MGRQIPIIKDGHRVEPANLDFLPKTYAKIQPQHRRFDKFDAMWQARVESGQIQHKPRSGSSWDKKK
jgi:hypothetical protein